MELKEYQKLTKTTAKKHDNKELALSNWALGIIGEAGDISSCIKKVVFHKNEAVKEGIKENIGDLMWYLSTLCNEFDWELQEILNENIEKLKKRFPQGFTNKDAQRKGTMIKWSGQE